jgi:hypothetical protein
MSCPGFYAGRWSRPPLRPGLHLAEDILYSPSMRRPKAAIGRGVELEQLAALLHADAPLTVIGPPGVGKTALVRDATVRVARERGVRLVSIDCVNDSLSPREALLVALDAPSDLLPDTKAGALHLLDAVRRAGPSIYVFDGCDGALSAVRDLAEAMREELDDGALVFTSRQRIGVTSEVLLELGPLSVPEPGAPRDEIASNPAVALLGRNRNLPLGELAEIARRLDGLPAALELAAALLDTVSPRELLLRLSTIGRGLNHTLRTAWEPLSEDLRGTLHSAAMFGRAFSLAELEAASPSARASGCAQALHQLVSRSLVVLQPGAAQRFRLLSAVRDFVLAERAGADGAAAEIYAFDSALVDRAERSTAGPQPVQSSLLRCAERRLSHDERDALGRRALVAIDATALPHDECRVLERRLAAFSTAPHDPHGLELRCQRARLLSSLLRVEDALGEAEDALFDHEPHAEPSRLLRPYLLVAELHARLGRAESAREALQRADAIAHCGTPGLGGPQQELAVLMSRGNIEWLCGTPETMFEVSVCGLALAERSHEADAAITFRSRVGQSACSIGHRVEGRAELTRAIDLATSRDAKRIVISSTTALGFDLLAEGAYDAAASRFDHAKAIAQAEGYSRLALWAEHYAAITTYLTNGDARPLDDVALRADLDEPLFLFLPLFATLTGSLLGRTLLRDGRERIAGRLDESAFLAPFLACCDAAATGDLDTMRASASCLPPAFRHDFAHAARVIEATRARSTAPSGPGPLRVATDGSWFEPGRHPRISLRGSTTRRLLLCLARAHDQRRPVSLEELRDAAWPGDRALRDALANRLYVALTRLRDKGLREWLVRSEDGWSIHPESELGWGEPTA